MEQEQTCAVLIFKTWADMVEPEGPESLAHLLYLYHRNEETYKSLINTVMLLCVVWTQGWSLQIKRDVSLVRDQSWECYLHYSLLKL